MGIAVTGKYRYICKNGKLQTVHRTLMHEIDPRNNESELVVHHIDGNKSNNDITNLTWMPKGDHIRLHKFG